MSASYSGIYPSASRFSVPFSKCRRESVYIISTLTELYVLEGTKVAPIALTVNHRRASCKYSFSDSMEAGDGAAARFHVTADLKSRL